MRLSEMFGSTLWETPAEAQMASHRLSVRAGLTRQLAAGIYSYMPLGWRVVQNIAEIIRQEMDAIGGQELSMPLVNPAEIWQASGRYDASAPGATLLRFQDRGGHHMVLAMTHEEVITELARQEIQSYRQLPRFVYQIQRKFRDEERSRGGLIHVREFLMKDGYSFHDTEESLQDHYGRVREAYERIFSRCGLETVLVEASSGMTGGQMSQEFMIINEDGEDNLVLCDDCEYGANVETAEFAKGQGIGAAEKPMERIATPGKRTIAEVAAFVGVEERQTLKAVFYTGPEGELILALIRGDLEVNDDKVSRALRDADLQPASPEAVKAAGLVPGYASPVGTEDVRIIADDSIQSGSNFVAGANEEGYHLKNVNYPRNFAVDVMANIALATEGATCKRCGGHLSVVRGIEVGHLLALGTQYSEKMDATFLNQEGETKPLIMGCYGMGLGRLMACIIEQHHDEKGIIWPPSVAPWPAHLVCLGRPGSKVEQTAEALYAHLRKSHGVLYDDRDCRAGIKFNDAELIGLPVRLVVSRRTLEKEVVELQPRWEEQSRLVPRENVAEEIDQALAHWP